MSERENHHPLGFEVIDKRGANRPVEEAPKPVAVIQDFREVSDRKWVSVAFVITLSQGSNGEPVVLGRALGLADDENIFQADYIFGMRWEPGFDWTVDAKRRLDTFLTCTCSRQSGPCQYHRRVAPVGWAKEDLNRIREENERVVPKVIEVLSRGERDRIQATRILTPRR